MSNYSQLSCSCVDVMSSNGSFPVEIHCRNRNRPRTSPVTGSVKVGRERDMLPCSPSVRTKRWPSPRFSNSKTSRGCPESDKYLVISPGYTMKRSKDYIEVRLEEKAFGSVTSEQTRQPFAPRHNKQDSLQKQKKKEEMSLIRGDIVEDLQEQIAKLTALLEQETSDHHKTQLRMTRELEQQSTELQNKKGEEIRILQENHAAELLKLQHEDNARLAEMTEKAENKYEALQKEMEFLKGSFKTFQESLSEEMNELWLQKEASLKESLEEQKLMEISKQRHSLLDKFEVEKKEILKRALEEQEIIQQSHKAQNEEAWKKYKEANQEAKMLNILKTHLQSEIAEKNEAILSLNMELQQAHLEIAKLKNEIHKIEKNFDQSVSKVESKFKSRIQSLMMENADLRRKLIAKTEQLFSERNKHSPKTKWEAHGVC